ncbi:MAG: matrixin family metalloprotease [Nisaea sp.]|uniref:matrixin family metalloprotease n=1 Tax=Nisaea sp. TaxID=2024842 RepID=UPI001B1DA1C8|nr:matrixin family metalloprotease [Nisaea sp.]MBO6561373.1 matrixin family metalloprotease [Nisaea sp.]
MASDSNTGLGGASEGHSVGLAGQYSHDHGLSEPRSSDLQRASEGGLSVRSSDVLGFTWTTTINYSFDGSSLGYSSFDSTYQARFETAMATWSNVANITFNETSAANADWVIAWEPNSDGRGGVLGTAYYIDVGNDGRMVSGTDSVIIFMDQADTQYFLSTAIHEAGHGLGLDHINHTPSIMSTFLDTSLSTITSYDIEVIQSLYGAAGSGTTTPGTAGTENADSLFGSSADDVLSGAGGSDTISGGAGNDLIYGNKETDLLFGGSGSDTIFGGQNNGPVSGSPLAQREGSDTIYGGDGNDILYGNHGSDIINGDAGADTIFGGQDADTISGGAGYDDLYGNLGADRFRYANSNEGWDYIHGYQAEDAIQLTGGVTATSVTADSFGDTVIRLSSGTRIDLIGYSDSASVTFEVV